MILLNTRRRMIGMRVLSQGTLDTLLVHPREVFRSAIAAGAAAMVIVHNHPCGDPTPSEQDIKVTRDLPLHPCVVLPNAPHSLRHRRSRPATGGGT